MTEDRRLATSQQQVTIPNADQLHSMLAFADNVVKSGLLPSHIKTAQAAFAVMQMGKELGIPPMTALRSIYVISGKPTCDAALMQALIYRDHGDGALMPVESTNEKCTYRFKRAGWSEYQEYCYTRADAEQAGLWGNKGPWTSYPRDMLRSRCISVIARMAFQDTISGMYTYEELGADVAVSPDGDIQIVSPPADMIPAEINETSDDSDYARFAPSLRAAETTSELEAIGEMIAEEQITGKPRVALGRLFKQRQAELEAVDVDPEEEAELDEAWEAGGTQKELVES